MEDTMMIAMDIRVAHMMNDLIALDMIERGATAITILLLIKTIVIDTIATITTIVVVNIPEAVRLWSLNLKFIRC